MSEEQTIPQKQPLNKPTKLFFKLLRLHTLNHRARHFERLMPHDKFSAGVTLSSQIIKAQKCLPWQRWWQSPWRFSAQLPRVPCAWPAPPGAGNAILTQGQPCRAWTCKTSILGCSGSLLPTPFLTTHSENWWEEVSLKPPHSDCRVLPSRDCSVWGRVWTTEARPRVRKFFLYWTEVFASQPASPCNEITALGEGNYSFSAGLTTNRIRTRSEQQGIPQRAGVQTRLKMSVLERTELEILSQMQQFYCSSFTSELKHSSS